MYAQHTVFYPKLSHYFHEFDIWDRETETFLDTETRSIACHDLVANRMLAQVPVVHVGMLTLDEARKLMNHAPVYGEDRPEGLYLKIERGGVVVGRYKLVHDEFIQSIIDSDDHWKYKVMVKNILADNFDITKRA